MRMLQDSPPETQEEVLELLISKDKESGEALRQMLQGGNPEDQPLTREQLQEKGWVPLARLAEAFGCSANNIRQHVKSGHLDAEDFAKAEGGRWYVSPELVKTFEDSVEAEVVADAVGVHANTIRKWASEGKIPAFTLGKRWIIRRVGILTLLLGRYGQDPQLSLFDSESVLELQRLTPAIQIAQDKGLG